jgi:glutaminase
MEPFLDESSNLSAEVKDVNRLISVYCCIDVYISSIAKLTQMLAMLYIKSVNVSYALH